MTFEILHGKRLIHVDVRSAESAKKKAETLTGILGKKIRITGVVM